MVWYEIRLFAWASRKSWYAIPHDFGSIEERNKVFMLKKALFGLKTLTHAWFARPTQIMISLGCHWCQGDHTLSIKHSFEGKLTLLLVYANDMTVARDDEHDKLILKEKFAARFEKDLQNVKFFLGIIEVAYSKRGISIFQRKYLLGLLIEMSMIDCKATRYPIEQK